MRLASSMMGITEDFNRIPLTVTIKLLQRHAYGTRNFNYFLLRGLAQCG